MSYKHTVTTLTTDNYIDAEAKRVEAYYKPGVLAIVPFRALCP